MLAAGNSCKSLDAWKVVVSDSHSGVIPTLNSVESNYFEGNYQMVPTQQSEIKDVSAGMGFLQNNNPRTHM